MKAERLPRYPVYIVSKGRWESRLTHKALSQMGIAHFIVIEEQEREAYAAVVDQTATLLTLDMQYLKDYDTCDELGETKGKGPGAARNFAWDHSIKLGAKSHWVMDDNIRNFYRRYDNMRIPVRSPAAIRCMEDFFDRYENVGMAGPYYKMFAPDRSPMPAFYTGTRVYSCNLIRNDMPYRWRGRYNEDTDLSLRMLKDGWCTIQFVAIMQDKIATQTMKGGNHDMFYAVEGTLAKSQMQVALHPDISTLVFKWGRWHHHVDYSSFRKMKLIRKPGIVIKEGVNNYGMILQDDTEGEITDEQDVESQENTV